MAVFKKTVLVLIASGVLLLSACRGIAIPFLERELSQSRANSIIDSFITYANEQTIPDEYSIYISTLLPGDITNNETLDAVKYDGKGIFVSESFIDLFVENAQPQRTDSYYLDGVYWEKHTTYSNDDNELKEIESTQDERQVSWKEFGYDEYAKSLLDVLHSLLNGDYDVERSVSKINAQSENPDMNYLISLDYSLSGTVELLEHSPDRLEIRAMTNKDATQFSSVVMEFSCGFEQGAEIVGYNPYQVRIIFNSEFADDFDNLTERIEELGV